MKERDLGWLAGIVDGEGTITICRILENKKKNRVFHMRPIFQIVNTNITILLEVQRLIGEIIGKKPSICLVKRYTETTLDCYRIQVTKFADVEKLLNVLKPYFVGKVEQARLILDFLEIRKNVIRRPRYGIKGGQHKPYGEQEEAILIQVKSLNNYRIRRDLTLGSSSKEDKRKSDLHSDMQSEAEMTSPLN